MTGWFFKLIRKELTEEQKKGFIQFVKFCIVGVTNTLISYLINVAVLALLKNTSLSEQTTWGDLTFSPDVVIGNTVAFILSVLWSFYWNNKYVFSLEKGQKRNLFLSLMKTYASYSVTGIFLTFLLSWLWVDVLGISKFLAPIINLFISVPVNFLLNKLWAFKSKKVEE
ncbi:MAG: GtrA family protein [Saccharofermentans sp.]|nr:GtrA family protein [Saccharofermentans sp.]